MPLPVPKHKEKKSDFVGRCMSEIGKDKAFKDSKQRVAVCYHQFEQAKASAEGVVDLEKDEMLLLSSEKKTNNLGDDNLLFSEDGLFPIMIPMDVKDAINNFGRIGKDMGFEIFIYKLYHKARSKGPEFVNMIPADLRKEYKLFS